MEQVQGNVKNPDAQNSWIRVIIISERLTVIHNFSLSLKCSMHQDHIILQSLHSGQR